MTKDHFLSGKKIIVVGGGIAAATFIATLSNLWNPSLNPPEITVIEQSDREACIQKDPYILSLNGGSKDEGLVALQQLGLLDEIREHATLNSGVIRVWSDNWKELASMNPKPYGDLPSATMRIERQHLKSILLDKAEDARNITWRWGHSCTTAERLANGQQIRVTILDNKKGNSWIQDCDLLIAADGPNSKIRSCLRPHDAKLEYAGATQIGGISRLPNGLPAPVDEDYGLQMSSGEGVCCIYTPFDNQTIGWALSKVEPRQEAQSGSSIFPTVKKNALQTGSMFQEPFKTIVEATDPTTAFIRPAEEKRAFRHDPHLQGIIFIGDANHVLSPYELVGANLALKDGWDLAEQICQNESLNMAVIAYDKLSVPRVEHVFDFSHTRIGFGHSTGWKWLFYKHGMAVQRAVGYKG